jgi:hypothetical protein
MVPDEQDRRQGVDRRKRERRSSAGRRNEDGLAENGPPEYERAAKEYNAAVSMVHDQGQLLWLVVGIFLLPESWLLSEAVRPVVGVMVENKNGTDR